MTSPPVRIITAYDKRHHPAWLARVEVWQALASAAILQDQRSSLSRIFFDIFWTIRLLIKARRYDVVLTGSDRIGLLTAAIIGLSGRRKPRHIFIDFLVNVSDGQPLRRSFYRLAAKGAFRVLVQATAEIGAYARALRLDPQKFTFARYHATIYDTEFSVNDGGYIFAGGDTHRDYSLLLEAVRDLPYRVIIAAKSKKHFQEITIPPNVEIKSVGEQQYIQLMAKSSIVVVPMQWKPQHIGGEQTYANAMTMGKATIVTALTASDYIQDQVTGILTPAGNIGALRSAILALMGNPELRRTIGDNAKQAAIELRPERFFAEVFKVCDAQEAPPE